MTIDGNSSYFHGNLISHKHQNEIPLSGLGFYLQFCGGSFRCKEHDLPKIGALHAKAETVVMKLMATSLGTAGGKEAFASENESCRCSSGGVEALPQASRPSSKQGDEVVQGTSSLNHGGLSAPMVTQLPPTKFSNLPQ